MGIPDHLILRLKINADSSGIARMFVPTAANNKVSNIFMLFFSVLSKIANCPVWLAHG